MKPLEGKLKKIIEYLPLVNTLILVAAGTLGYLFVTSEQVEEFIANTEFATASTRVAESQLELNRAELPLLLEQQIRAEAENQIAPLREATQLAASNSQTMLNLAQARVAETDISVKELELEVASANSRIAELELRSNVSLDLSSLLADIQPNARFANCSAARVRAEVRISCSQENIGTHRVYFAEPEVWITDEITREEIDSDSYVLRGIHSNNVMPNNHGSMSFYVSGNPRLFQGSITIHFRSEVSTNSIVVDVLRELLGPQVDDELLTAMSIQKYSMNFAINDPL